LCVRACVWMGGWVSEWERQTKFWLLAIFYILCMAVYKCFLVFILIFCIRLNYSIKLVFVTQHVFRIVFFKAAFLAAVTLIPTWTVLMYITWTVLMYITNSTNVHYLNSTNVHYLNSTNVHYSHNHLLQVRCALVIVNRDEICLLTVVWYIQWNLSYAEPRFWVAKLLKWLLY